MQQIIDRICVVLGALFFMQAPVFLEQYIQRLGGHMKELETHVATMQKIANAHQKSLEEYIHYFQLHNDGIISAQGQLMESIVQRYEAFKIAFHSLVDASLLELPFLFFYHIKFEVLSDALSYFQPGMTFSAETIIYGAVGGFLGYFLFRLMKTGLNFISQKMKAA